jgi:hypothetical protein
VPKLKPLDRWRIQVLERYVAFRQSGELARLRRIAESVLARNGITDKKRLLTGEEWWKTCAGRNSLPEYVAWREECRVVGERFGLAPWTIEMACLLKGYRAQDQLHVVEAKWPTVRVVTQESDQAFLARLAYEAQKQGMQLFRRQGSEETLCLYMNPVPITMLEPPPLPSTMPPLYSAFTVRVETPIGFPPEAAQELHKTASRAYREILRNLGYRVPQRLRSSPLVEDASKLRVGKRHLAKRELYCIVAEVL